MSNNEILLEHEMQRIARSEQRKVYDQVLRTKPRIFVTQASRPSMLSVKETIPVFWMAVTGIVIFAASKYQESQLRRWISDAKTKSKKD